jgi:hypothetical protein
MLRDHCHVQFVPSAALYTLILILDFCRDKEIIPWAYLPYVICFTMRRDRPVCRQMCIAFAHCVEAVKNARIQITNNPCN